MKLGALTLPELTARLARGGLDMDTGPFVVRIETEIPALAEEIHLLYGDFSVDEGGGLADFHVSVRRPAGPLGLRRWWRQQVKVYLDEARPFEPLPIDMAVPVLEWSINWCAATQANQYVMIHAAVLERDRRVLVLPGVSGAGKSTLCAGLALRGWRLFSDEFALIRPAYGQVDPWPRPISLKNDSIEVIRRWAPDSRLSTLVPNTKKGTMAHLRPPAGSVERVGEPAMPAWIVFPTFAREAAPQLTRLPRARAFFKLADCSFNYESLGLRGFTTLSRMIDGCDAYEFTYSSLEDAQSLLGALPLP